MDLNKEKYDIEDLTEIVKRLRAPDGCPWDKVQTHKSIRKDFIEEVYEAVEAAISIWVISPMRSAGK